MVETEKGIWKTEKGGGATLRTGGEKMRGRYGIVFFIKKLF